MQSNDARRSIFRARSTTTISRARLRFLTLMAAWIAVVVPPTPLDAVAVSSDIDPSTAFTSWQWILVQNVPGPCPVVTGWSEAQFSLRRPYRFRRDFDPSAAIHGPVVVR